MATVGACLDATNSIHIAFGVGIVVTAALIARHNRLSFKDTVRAVFGLHEFERSLWISLAVFATFLVPIGLGIWTILTCDIPSP